LQAIVAIHDASPAYQKQVNKISETLAKEGIEQFSYLVIPKLRNREANQINSNEEFVSSLKDSGKDLLLHGYTHWKRVSQNEFSGIRYETAKEKLDAGKEMFKEAFGYMPDGFVPPMWLMSKQALQAVKDSGFKYTVHYGTVIDFEKNLRVKTSIILNGGIFFTPSIVKSIIRIKTSKPLQITFHPKDTGFRAKVMVKMLRMAQRKGYEFFDYAGFIKSLEHQKS